MPPASRRGWRSSQILPRRRPRDPRGLDFLRPRAALPDALTRCRHELTSDGARIGGQGQRQTLARSRRRHVHDDEPAALGKGGRPAEAQREVEPLAEQQHEVGLTQAARRAAQARIVDAARALHQQGRDPGQLTQPLDVVPACRTTHGRTRDDQRTPGLAEQVERPADEHVVHRARVGGRSGRRRRTGHASFEQVSGQAQVHGPRRPRRRERKRPRHLLAHALGALDHPRRLADGPRGADLIDLLERAASSLGAWRVPAQQHDGRLGHQRGVQRRDGVEMTGTGGDQRHARLFRHARPAVGHVHGGGLVPRVDQCDVAAHRRVIDGENLVAGQREQMAHAGHRQRIHEEISAARGHGSRILPRSRVSNGRHRHRSRAE